MTPLNMQDPCAVLVWLRHVRPKLTTADQHLLLARVFSQLLFPTPVWVFDLQALMATLDEADRKEPPEPELSVGVRFVVHGPYPDGSFRGLEKSQDLLWPTEAEAQAYIDADPSTAKFFQTMPVVLVTPSIRRPLDAVKQALSYAHLFQPSER